MLLAIAFVSIGFVWAGIEPNRLGAVHVAVEMHKCEQALTFATALVAEFPGEPAALGALEDAKRCTAIRPAVVAPGVLPGATTEPAPTPPTEPLAVPMETAAPAARTLRFTGLPAGAVVRVTDAGGLPVDQFIGWSGTTIDPSIALPVGESALFENIAPGPCHWQVQQHLLGEIAGNVTVALDGPTDVDAPWSTMPGVLRLQRLRTDWERRVATAQMHDAYRKRSTTFGIAAGGLAAGAITGVLVGFVEQAEADSLDAEYNAAVVNGNQTAADAATAERKAHTTASAVALVLGGVAGTLGALSLGITIHEADQARATKTAPPPWDPEHMAPR